MRIEAVKVLECYFIFETSPAKRDASGLVWPAYLLPGLFRYGIEEGVLSCSKVKEQILIPG